MHKETTKLRKYQRKNKIDRASAEAQVQLLNDYYDVDLDFVLEAGKAFIEVRMMGLTKSIMRGRLEVVDTKDGVVIKQYLENPPGEVKSVNYKEADHSVHIALNRASKDANTVDVVLGALSELGEEFFTNLNPVDRATAEDVGHYFLLV